MLMCHSYQVLWTDRLTLMGSEYLIGNSFCLFDSLPYSLVRSITEWKPAVLVRLAGQGQGAPRICLSLAPNSALTVTHSHTHSFIWVLGFKLRPKYLCSKHSYTLSHLPSPLASIFIAANHFIVAWNFIPPSTFSPKISLWGMTQSV